MFSCKVGKNKKALLSVKKKAVCELADMLTISTMS